MKKQIPWDKIRKEYARGDISVKALAEKYGLSYLTVRNRCTKEKWRLGRTEVEQRFDQALARHIDDKALSLAERAAVFRERQLDEGEQLLDLLVKEVRPLLDRRDVDGIRKYVSSWVDLVKTQRTAFGLDQPSAGAFNVAMTLNAVEIKLNPEDQARMRGIADSRPVIDVPSEAPDDTGAQSAA